MTLGWFDDFMHSQSLTVQHVEVGEPNADGVAQTTTVPIVLEGYSVQPVGSTETDGAEKVVTSRWRASGPVTDSVREFDTVEWNGDLYDVEGNPRTYTGGVFDHTEFFLTMNRR